MSHRTPVWSWMSIPPDHLRTFSGSGAWRGETIAELARQCAQKDPEVDVFPNLSAGWTYGRIFEDARALAASLYERGLRPGDVVSFQTPNWPEACVINVAAAMGGWVINPIVIIYRDAEVRQMLADCRSKVLFICEEFRHYDFAAMVDRIKPDLPDLDHVAFVRSRRSGGYEDLIESGRASAFEGPTVDSDEVKLLLYTSGTTGRPKAVLHSHNTLARAVYRCVDVWNVEPGDHILMPSPVTHVSGYSNGLELPYLGNTRTVLMESWNADVAADLMLRYRVAGTVAATPFLAELTEVIDQRGTPLTDLKFFACGGAEVPPDVVRRANSAFGNSCVFRVYGSSEAPLVTLGFQGEEHAELAATTDGRCVDYTLRIVSEAGTDLPSGKEGEIRVRGPSMFMGYADPQHTSESIDESGFFKTGDLGYLTSDNAVCISGRKKDLIIRGGENISAKEIEDVLGGHAGVAEVAVVAMPHARLGEGVCAFVIAGAESPPTAEALLEEMARSGLAKQKWPERFEFVDALPRTASGKIRKDVLRQQARELSSAQA